MDQFVTSIDLSCGRELRREYYSDGSIKSERTYGPKGLEGCCIEWYQSGKRSNETWFRDGIEWGPFRGWCESGVLRIEGQTYDNASEGLWRFWYRSGVLWMEGEFVDDSEVGVWVYFDENGTLEATVDFGDGNTFFNDDIGFDYETLRDVPIEWEPGEQRPDLVRTSFFRVFRGWQDFVESIPQTNTFSPMKWAHGLLSRDDIENIVQQHPELRKVVQHVDDEYCRLTTDGHSVSVDRTAWWWLRRPHAGLSD